MRIPPAANLVIPALDGNGDRNAFSTPSSPRQVYDLAASGACYAVQSNQIEILEKYWRLIQLDPNTRLENGQTLLTYATQNSSDQTVQFLLESGARTDLADSFGFDPLMVALMCRPDLVEVFLLWGADVNGVGPDRNTPLHMAILLGASIEIVKILLGAQGIKTDIKNNNGKTALDLAQSLTNQNPGFERKQVYIELLQTRQD